MSSPISSVKQNLGRRLLTAIFLAILFLLPVIGIRTTAYGNEPPRWAAGSEDGRSIRQDDNLSFIPLVANNAVVQAKKQIELEDLVISHLAQNIFDTWVLTVPEAEKLTVMVAPAEPANIILSLWDEDGTILVDRQDLAPLGEVETIADFSVSEPGNYQILVSSDTPMPTDYAVMVLAEESYAFRFRGTLASGIERTDALLADNDHFWFFSATAGEAISMQIAPEEKRDAYVELYGPEGQRLQTIDDGSKGEPEVLENYAIQSTGMYGIRVGEFNFLPMTYTIGLQIH